MKARKRYRETVKELREGLLQWGLADESEETLTLQLVELSKLLRFNGASLMKARKLVPPVGKQRKERVLQWGLADESEETG